MAERPRGVDADRVIAAALQAGVSVATAESLTGGAVCATLVSVPGASAVMRGGVVAYLAEVKQQVLGVDAELLSRAGVVSEETALSMARGARAMFGADIAVATTGAAGPEAHDGAPAGTVCVAVAWERGERAVTARVAGDRAAVTEGAVGVALSLVSEAVAAVVAAGSADC